MKVMHAIGESEHIVLHNSFYRLIDQWKIANAVPAPFYGCLRCGMMHAFWPTATVGLLGSVPPTTVLYGGQTL